MAEEVKNEESPKTEKADTSKKSGPGILTWVIMFLMVTILGGSGFFLGRLFAGPSKHAAETSTQKKDTPPAENKKEESGKSTEPQKTWYYNLDPVVANLDVPGATRYIRATLTLEMDPSLEQKKGTELLGEKKPILINWLTIYLSSLTLEDVTGANNLKRIQAQMLDSFNEEVFPNSKPLIKKVLLKEFPIQ
jgi:flagellar basal body-associated protein FliL